MIPTMADRPAHHHRTIIRLKETVMTKHEFPLIAAFIAIASFATSGCAAASKDKPVKLATQDIPENVMRSVNVRLPGASVTSVEKEKEHGGIVYDFELTQNGRKYEMDVNEGGTILEIEKEVALKDAPKAVISAVQAKYPSASIQQVMEVNKVNGTQETPDHYEITVLNSGKKEEVVVSLDGKSVKEEDEEGG
jgi:hypothetical protein